MRNYKIAESIPHEFRVKILTEWLPVAKASMGNQAFQYLWETYFIYIEPNGERKVKCQQCINNVLDNWRYMQKHLIKAEQDYQLLESVK